MNSRSQIKKTLSLLKKGKITLRKAFGQLKDLPYLNLGFAKIDTHRHMRRGFPEVIFGDGKPVSEITRIVKVILKNSESVLITKAKPRTYEELRKLFPGLEYDKAAGMIYTQPKKTKKKGAVLIITGGTSDIPVAQEAKRICELMGNKVTCLYDVGVAGIHRLLDFRSIIKRAKVIIVVAGMEGALASVVSGLVGVPVIAVPTSVGYGASFRGIAPLLTMMNSCSPGIAVVNIDNGFGAGYFAGLVNK
ncbi:MAG: nickel pincer cofactor biosynthesis protein LarB [Candidatus Omnitrophota bacterium]